tara:strand:- start:8 stop:748 length:741 start_codon:yes stop_codon:yes gene_type:complete
MAIFSKLLDITGFFLIVVINLSLIALLCYYAKKKFESIEEIQREQSKVLFDLVSKSTSSSIDPMFLSVQTSDISFTPNTELEENKIINLSENINQDIDTCLDEVVLNDNNNFKLLNNDTEEDNEESEEETEDEEETEEETEEDEDDEEETEEGEDDEEETEEDNEEETEQDNENKKEGNMIQDEDEEDQEEESKSIEINFENESEINLEKMTISELKNYIESKGEKLSSKKTKKSDILEYIKTNNL